MGTCFRNRKRTGPTMRNILLWAGIAVLAFQDYFKKPVKPTRQQQFFQTGGTSQAFIEGVESSTTQRKNTIKSYQKVAEKIKAMFGNVSILDYGAGLGLGTEMMKEVTGGKVDSFEPYPVNWESNYPVTYTNSSSIKKKYDVIVSLNVLNVLPEEIRDNAIRSIYKNLKKGGTAFISTRKWSGDVNAAKNFEKGPEYKSIIVLTKGQRVFQKGFDGNELVDYVYEVLGDSVDIVKSNFGANSVMLIKL